MIIRASQRRLPGVRTRRVSGPRFMRLSWGTHGVWLFPATYVVHLIEEYYAAEGFPVWAGQALGLTLSGRAFIAWNAVGLAFMCAGAALVARRATLRWIEIAMSLAVLTNVAGHVAASVLTESYSPGVITGVIAWAPLGMVRLPAAYRFASRQGRVIGLAVGLAVTLATLAVLTL